ncbi:hypothetical protein [Thaumasiovibrio subtropicus]|uniref:hypothetical protein n=1 Tax=Thaumasiovibrio subtropicus TaxID=1891207 RepID=UPI000B3509E5|nr:hypothetical protein [Thaumasiovibrio subtropicus]
MRLSRRGWNNVIIIGALLFIAAVQLPELWRDRLQSAQNDAIEVPAGLERLLPDNLTIDRMVFPQQEIALNESGEWQVENPIPVAASELVSRWQQLLGTQIDEQTRDLLKPQLTHPQTVEVWFDGIEEPVRVTVYEMPQFWLMQNWQAEWIAISVEKNYLFP